MPKERRRYDTLGRACRANNELGVHHSARFVCRRPGSGFIRSAPGIVFLTPEMRWLGHRDSQLTAAPGPLQQAALVVTAQEAPLSSGGAAPRQTRVSLSPQLLREAVPACESSTNEWGAKGGSSGGNARRGGRLRTLRKLLRGPTPKLAVARGAAAPERPAGRSRETPLNAEAGACEYRQCSRRDAWRRPAPSSAADASPSA